MQSGTLQVLGALSVQQLSATCSGLGTVATLFFSVLLDLVQKKKKKKTTDKERRKWRTKCQTCEDKTSSESRRHTLGITIVERTPQETGEGTKIEAVELEGMTPMAPGPKQGSK